MFQLKLFKYHMRLIDVLELNQLMTVNLAKSHFQILQSYSFDV